MTQQFIGFTDDINDNSKHYIQFGKIENAVGKRIKEITLREDNEDLCILLEDGTDLRVFGENILPSYAGEKLSSGNVEVSNGAKRNLED